MSKRKQTLKEQLEEANAEIKWLRDQLEKSNSKEGLWRKAIHYLYRGDDSALDRECLLNTMNYRIWYLPNNDKSIFHDTLKGFEEFSKLKG